jgi:hypothetical protein
MAPLPRRFEVKVPKTPLDHALEYIDRGWKVFPCRPAHEEAVDPETGEVRIVYTAKSPLTSNGFRSSTLSERIVNRWWDDWPDAMIGVPMGAETGAFVLDLDVKDKANGFDWLTEMEAIHGGLPETLTAITASGGQHRYFKFVEGVRNRQSKDGIAPGVDLRGEGGYCVMPGSVNAAGDRYTWFNPNAEIADAPAWLLDIVVKKEVPVTLNRTSTVGAAGRNPIYVDAAVSAELGQLAATKSQRNNALNDAAFALGQFVGAGALDRTDMERRLLGAAAANGYVAKKGERAALATIKSGLDAGQQQPREIPADDDDGLERYMPAPTFKANVARKLAEKSAEAPGANDNAPIEDEVPKKRERFDLTWFDNIENAKPKKTFIKGVFGDNEFSYIVGKPGTGKSVITTDMACHVAAGMEWHGRRVKQGLVVYLAAERKDLTERRMLAFRKRHGVQDVPLLVVGGRIDLTGNINDARTLAGMVNQAAEACEMPCVWVIIDTLTRTFGGGDQNATKDMSAFVQSCDEILNLTKAHVTVIHHTGWSTDRAKGSIDLDGAVDASFIVNKADGNYVLACDGTNDGEAGVITHFRMESVEVGIDEDGEPTKAPVVVKADDKPKKLVSGKSAAVLDALVEAIEKEGIEPTGHHFPDGVMAVTEEQWRAAYYDSPKASQNDDTRIKQFSRGRTQLIESDRVGSIGQWHWLNEMPE